MAISRGLSGCMVSLHCPFCIAAMAPTYYSHTFSVCIVCALSGFWPCFDPKGGSSSCRGRQDMGAQTIGHC